MGAQLSTVAPTVTVPIDAYISEIGDLAWASDLGRARFLKTVKATHRDGYAVVKVFIKPSTLVDLGPMRAKIREQTLALIPVCNAIGWTRLLETERAGYLGRQFIKHNLYDRISTRPFLEPIEKKWIVFQMLRCLADTHKMGICHGDLKCENVLVNSWKWVYVVDWASYKPVKLPETDSSVFLFYFDTSQRRTCYVAPERFGADGPEQLTPEMDIYSAGCVIAELFLDGQPLFTLADLFGYKRGEKKPALDGIKDKEIRDMILSMVSLDPKERKSAEEYLHSDVFPSFFWTLWDLYSRFCARSYESADPMISHTWDNFDVLLKALDAPLQYQEHIPTPKSILPVAITLPSGTFIPTSLEHRRDGALMVLSIVCSSIRASTHLVWRKRAIDLVLALSVIVDDEIRLDRCLPYFLALVRGREEDVIKSQALTHLTHLLTMVTSFTSLNEKVYSEYLFPRLEVVATNSSPYVKSTYAYCLPTLASLASKVDPSVGHYIEEQTRSLLTEKSSVVRRAFLRSADPLCSVLGQQKTNDIVLSHAITYLNDRNPQVRIDLFDFVGRIAPLVGPASLEQYMIPLMIQSLVDPREDVVIVVLRSLGTFAELGLIRLKLVWSLLPTVSKFSIHPNVYIRTQLFLLVSFCAAHMAPAQVYCLLRPIFKMFMECEVVDWTDYRNLAGAVRPPISSTIYSLALQWVRSARKTAFWRTASNSDSTPAFSQEDRRWLSRLRDAGFKNEDLWQLVIYRDYLWQIARVPPPHQPPADDVQIKPTNLGEHEEVPPHLERYVKTRNKSESHHTNVVIQNQKVGHRIDRPSSTSSSENEVRPAGTLVSSIKAHRGAIEALAVCADEYYFATGADDGLLKIWDCRQLARGASRPAVTFEFGVRISTAIWLECTSIICVATADGILHFLDSVDDSLISVAEFHYDAAAVSLYHQPKSQTMWVLTTDCKVLAVDLPTLAYDHIDLPVEHGPPKCWAFDPQNYWAAIGTSHGMIDIIDLRFRLLVHSFGIGELAPVHAVCNHPTHERWIVVAGGFRSPLISTWDVSTQECRELLLPMQNNDDRPLPSLEPLDVKLDQFADWSLETVLEDTGVTALAVARTEPVVISGGGDRVLRWWNLLAPNLCTVVSGLPYTHPRVSYSGRIGSNVKYTYEKAAPASKRPERHTRIAVIANEEADIGRNHRGTITQVAVLARSREMIVSVDEVGIIKVFL